MDSALILESRDSIPEKRCSSCYRLKNKARIILVLLNKNGEERVISQNNKFIARGDEGGMLPYLESELTIENGLLTIFYQFTRSNQSYTFEFNNDRMEIVKAESNGVHSASGNFGSEKYYFRKGLIISETGHISTEKMESEIIEFNVEPKPLSEFEEMNEWEIAKYKRI